MFIFYFIFIIILFLLLVRSEINSLDKYFTWFVGIGLIVMAGCRGLGTDHDMLEYMKMFDKAKELSDFKKSNYEFIATLLPVFLRTIGLYSYLSVFFCFAVMSITPKIYAMTKYSYIPLVSMCIYFCHFFLLQDMTQVRAAVAISILFLSVEDIVNKNLIMFLFKVMIACIFHYSSMMFLFFYFLDDNSFNKKAYVVFLFGTLFIALSRVNILGIIPGLASMSDKLATYSDQETVTVNPLSVQGITNLGIILFQIYHIDKLRSKRYALIFLKLYSLSLVFFWGFSSMAVIAFRMSELIGIAAIYSIPNLYYIVKSKIMCSIFILLVCLVFLSLDLFRQHILMGYYLNTSIGLSDVQPCFRCNGNL